MTHSPTIDRCESGACIEVAEYEGAIRIKSTQTGTTMQATPAEVRAFVARVKAGELDHIGQEQA